MEDEIYTEIPKISIVNTKELRLARAKEEKTQEDMAKLLNISRGTYSKKENGLINITIDEAIAIAVELKMDFNTFNKIFAERKTTKGKDRIHKIWIVAYIN